MRWTSVSVPAVAAERAGEIPPDVRLKVTSTVPVAGMFVAPAPGFTRTFTSYVLSALPPPELQFEASVHRYARSETTKLQVPAGSPADTLFKPAVVLGSVTVPVPGDVEAKKSAACVGSAGFLNWSSTTEPAASVIVSGTA